ncbi:hypothetical protein AB4Y36_19455 [Paraburkholderia sp. BR10936]|uniref:hypothetical protein n=1 Tax=Paraburkholderia sp. BR10936 TaxID=3236993 RepID=UPI0034D2C4CC
MIADHLGDITVDVVKAAVPVARRLFDDSWLVEQASRRPSDILLFTELPMLSAREAARALREGVPRAGLMHPLAEAVIGSEKVIEYYERTGSFLVGAFVYRLLSLRDVARHLDVVGNMSERLSRLTGDQWQAALYELLVACSQAQSGAVELLPEGESAAPDMCVDRTVFVECKAKLQLDEKVAEFVGKFNRLARDKIFQEASKISNGLLIEIDIHDDAHLISLPGMLRSMFADRLKRKSTHYAKVKVTPYEPGPIDLPQNMSVHTARFWKWMMDFDGWRDWHVVSPFAEVQIANFSNLIATAVRRPVLVCVRSAALAHTEQNVRATVAAACRRQLREHQPGVVRVHVNSNLYGIGEKANVPMIQEALNQLSQSLLATYTRLVGVRFDIITPPDPGELMAQYTSAGAVRAEDSARFESIMSAPGVFLI